MTPTNLINKYKGRVPYEERGKEYDKLRKRESRKRELEDICEDLFFECEDYKRLKLNNYQKQRVKYLVDKFSNCFEMLHGQAKSETIILAFIFYIKLNEEPRIRLREYRITSVYGLTDNIFEVIVCRLAEYYIRNAPIVPVGSTNYDHDLLSKNGGKI